MKEYPDYEYTIVTTTNSLEMIKDHARHYEMATFIKKIGSFHNNPKRLRFLRNMYFSILKKSL